MASGDSVPETKKGKEKKDRKDTKRHKKEKDDKDFDEEMRAAAEDAEAMNNKKPQQNNKSVPSLYYEKNCLVIIWLNNCLQN